MNFENNNFEPTEYLPYDFANRRHIGPSPQEMEKMLKLLGLNSIDQLIDQTIPPSIRQKNYLIGISQNLNERCFSILEKQR